MNNLDKQYITLLQDILNNGVTKSDRTGTGTISVFGRQIRHDMKDGFPLITTKKMFTKGIVTELLWFLRGDTNIKFLIDNNVHIWDGDAYKKYLKWAGNEPLNMEQFIERIKADSDFAGVYGDLGPVYGKQWRSWSRPTIQLGKLIPQHFDQIATLIKDLKTNPDSRRLMVNAWNVGELDQMTLPPCHYGFQVYTRELSELERHDIKEQYGFDCRKLAKPSIKQLDDANIPTRAISLMWNQRSVDTFLGLPFNIASYGLLLEIIAKAVNMVPEELIGNLGDTHLYSNHIEQAKEQIGMELSDEERYNIWFTNNYETGMERFFDPNNLPDFEDPYYEPTPKQIGRELTLEERREMVTQEMFNQIYNGGDSSTLSHSEIDQWNVPRFKIREPYPLPALNINTEFWPTESGECGVGPLHSDIDVLIKNMQIEDFEIIGYQSHPTIKAPLSN
jgi:thymidylate synthase